MRMTEKSGIYGIKNKLNGKIYIGSASNISKRISNHKKYLRLNSHSNSHLQRAWNKYKEKNFEFLIIEITNNLLLKEQYWIDEFDSFKKGYNLVPKAGSSRGRFISEDEKIMRRKLLNNFRHLAQTKAAKQKRVKTRRNDRTLGQKLNWNQVKIIRKKYKPRKYVMQKLADEFKVGLITIYDVIHNKTWRTKP